MSENALPKGYEPHAVEDHWREYWEKNKTFTPDPCLLYTSDAADE